MEQHLPENEKACGWRLMTARSCANSLLVGSNSRYDKYRKENGHNAYDFARNARGPPSVHVQVSAIVLVVQRN